MAQAFWLKQKCFGPISLIDSRMVLCNLVRIKNTCSRTFYFVHAGDPWYTPRIGAVLYEGGRFEVPPGFDEVVEDLVIPWAAISTFFAELTFGASDSREEVKCVVGPGSQHCGDLDFVRLHTSDWQPLCKIHGCRWDTGIFEVRLQQSMLSLSSVISRKAKSKLIAAPLL